MNKIKILIFIIVIAFSCSKSTKAKVLDKLNLDHLEYGSFLMLSEEKFYEDEFLGDISAEYEFEIDKNYSDEVQKIFESNNWKEISQFDSSDIYFEANLLKNCNKGYKYVRLVITDSIFINPEVIALYCSSTNRLRVSLNLM